MQTNQESPAQVEFSPPSELDEQIRILADVRTLTVGVELEAREEVALPGWLGSTLHGALGSALERLGKGAYRRFFEPPDSGAAPRHLASMAPPALALAPPAPTNPQVLSRGDSLDFGIVVPARLRSEVGILLAALETAAETGMGRGRGRLRMRCVRDEHGTVWRDGRVMRPPKPDRSPRQLDSTTVTIRGVTPLHLLQAGERIGEPSFRDFIAAASRRLASYRAFHDGGAPDVHLSDLAAGVPSSIVADHEWRLWSAARYSNRQGRRHPVTGLLGSARYQGPVQPYLPLLAKAACLGIGKGPALGLGRFELCLTE